MVAAGLLIAIGMILQAHRSGPSTDSGSATAQAQGAAQSSTSSRASSARTPSSSSDNAPQTATPTPTPTTGFVATANVDDLPRVPAPRRYVVSAPVAPAAPHALRLVRSGAARAPGSGPNAASDSDTTADDSNSPTVQAAVAPSRKDTPAQDPATSEPAAMPAPATAPSATATAAAPEAPANEDPLLKAMRQAVDDQARGK
jgi:hypothetical protein